MAGIDFRDIYCLDIENFFLELRLALDLVKKKDKMLIHNL